ncbi:MAG: shikimate dehydrogenase [Saprospiraceae bacterium]
MTSESLLYGLIGKSLQHSFSPAYFQAKFEKLSLDAKYRSYPILDISEFPNLISRNVFKGLNVTIPYKTQIIKYLDNVDNIATSIDAVNTIAFRNGKLSGYNTDVIGFEQALKDFVGDFKIIKAALILGNGGAAKAVQFVLRCQGIPYLVITRNSNHDYEWLMSNGFGCHNLIVNTTPIGMYPDVNKAVKIPYDDLNENFFLFDLVYNPKESLFLSLGKQQGAHVSNGLKMLEYQAEAAWNIWNSK